MEKIYAPWREHYIKTPANKKNQKSSCVFCEQLAKKDDEKFFILKRFTHSFVILNLYPYNGGHLMVLPLTHKGLLTELSDEEQTEIMKVTTICTKILDEVLKPEGYNIGINLGLAGGGGIPSHLHVHLLPRWNGDTNFLPLLCDTKQVSTNLVTLYKRLKQEFDAIK